MANNVFLNVCQRAILLFLACSPLTAFSECSRAIKVPSSPIGLSVIVADDAISGVYPDKLRYDTIKELDWHYSGAYLSKNR